MMNNNDNNDIINDINMINVVDINMENMDNMEPEQAQAEILEQAQSICYVTEMHNKFYGTNLSTLEMLGIFKKLKIQYMNEFLNHYGGLLEFVTEKEICMLCCNNLVENFTHIKTLTKIRFLEYKKEKKLDNLGSWILKRVDKKYYKEAKTIYNALIEIETVFANNDKKIALLYELYELALLHPRIDIFIPTPDDVDV